MLVAMCESLLRRLLPQDIFTLLLDSINQDTSFTLWENSEKGQARVLTEEEIAVRDKHQRICLKMKLLNDKILLKILNQSLQLIVYDMYVTSEATPVFY